MFGAFAWFVVPFMALKIFTDLYQPVQQLVRFFRGPG
jgi:hypothetical protein